MCGSIKRAKAIMLPFGGAGHVEFALVRGAIYVTKKSCGRQPAGTVWCKAVRFSLQWGRLLERGVWVESSVRRKPPAVPPAKAGALGRRRRGWRGAAGRARDAVAEALPTADSDEGARLGDGRAPWTATEGAGVRPRLRESSSRTVKRRS